MALDPISAALDLGGKLIDRLWTDPAQKQAASLALLQLQQSGEIAKIAGQTDIDKAEASNPNMFVAGWRPGVGWVCAIALLEDMVLRPLIAQVSTLFGHPLILPPLDLSTLMPLMFGMLGLGAMRSYDKANGTGNGH